jgi:hypothetical protein
MKKGVGLGVGSGSGSAQNCHGFQTLPIPCRLFLRAGTAQLGVRDLHPVQREAGGAEERTDPLLCLDHQGQRGHSRQDTGQPQETVNVQKAGFIANPEDPDPAIHFIEDPDSVPDPHQSDLNSRPLVYRPFRSPF